MTGGIHGYHCVCGGHDTHGSRNTGGVYSSIASKTYDSYVAPVKEDCQYYSTDYYVEPATCVGTALIPQDAQPVTRRPSLEKNLIKTTRPMTGTSRIRFQHDFNCDCGVVCLSYREPQVKTKPSQRPRTASYGRPVPRDYLNFVNDASSKYWQVMGENSAKGKFFDRSAPTYHGPCCQRCHCRTRSSSPSRLTKSYRTTYDDDFNRTYRTSRNNGYLVTQPSGKHGAYYTGAGGYSSYWVPAAKYSQLASQLYANRPVHGYTYRTTYNDDYSRPSGKRGTIRNYSYQSNPKLGSNFSRGCCCCNLHDHALNMMSRS